MHFPTIRRANRLFLVTIAIILTLGSAIQFWSLPWGLVGTEVFLIFLPTWWFLRRDRLPLASVLRLRMPHPAALALSPLIGAGAWVLGAALNSLMETLMGYAPSGIPLEGSAVGVAALLVAIIILAPLCEEALFRGYIFRAYEVRGPGAAILASSLLFAFYHMRFQGLIPLLPVAFTLGYVRWRSDSFWPGVAVHLFSNATAVVGGIVWATLHPEQKISLPPALIVVSALVVAAALFAFHRFVRPAADLDPIQGPDPLAIADPQSLAELPLELAPSPNRAPEGRWARAWPLVVFAIIWLIIAGAEFVISRNPGLLVK